MPIDFNDLIRRAYLGEVMPDEIVRAYNFITDLDDINIKKRAERAVLARKMAAYDRAVESYAKQMRSVFGIEASLPTGDQQ